MAFQMIQTCIQQAFAGHILLAALLRQSLQQRGHKAALRRIAHAYISR